MKTNLKKLEETIKIIKVITSKIDAKLNKELIGSTKWRNLRDQKLLCEDNITYLRHITDNIVNF